MLLLAWLAAGAPDRSGAGTTHADRWPRPASGSQDRRVALPQSERRSRAGLFRRRSDRPDRDGSRAIQSVVRPVDAIHREVPGTVGRSSTASNGSSASIICWTAAFDAKGTKSDSRLVWSMRNLARSSGQRLIGDELIPSNVFEIQEDVSRQVSAIVASNYGMIAEAGLTEAQRRPPKSFAAYDCVLRYYHYQRSFDPQEHAKVRACLERAVELDPDYADAWAVLANIYAQEHRFGFNPRPELYDSHERSLAAAYRAVEIEPRNPTAQLMLANALFDRHDLAGFRAAGERAIALNPNDPEPLAHYGIASDLHGGMGAWACARDQSDRTQSRASAMVPGSRSSTTTTKPGIMSGR